jgi:uncharacterized damage-inducible protein DinB
MNTYINVINDIFAYNHWANKRLIENINQLSQEDYHKILTVPFASIHGLLQHLHYYQAKYFNKLVENTVVTANKEKLARKELAESFLFNSQQWLDSLEILLHNISGEDNGFALAVKMMDVNTHNTYHRGQINIIISMLGYKPESLDIFLFRDASTMQGFA